MTDDFDDDDGGVWSVCLKGCARVCERCVCVCVKGVYVCVCVYEGCELTLVLSKVVMMKVIVGGDNEGDCWW